MVSGIFIFEEKVERGEASQGRLKDEENRE